jgi:anti-repressor protein
MKSKLPDAEKFQDWVCEEVLPSIRKNGGYIATKSDDTPEMIMARGLQVAMATIEKQEAKIRLSESKIELLEEITKEQAPKVLFADSVAASEKSILIGELAKILSQSGCQMGQNRLFSVLRGSGYLCTKGESYNIPTQRAMELGLFEIKKQSITQPGGRVLITTTTKVTAKGQIYFVNKFLKAK